MNTTFQTTTIGDFLDNFAGRKGMEGYDEAKQIKIAECNRDFVWPLSMQQGFVCSILQGFPIPAMCITNGQIVDGGNRSTTLWLFRNGAFRVTLPGTTTELDYEAMCGDRALTRRWDSAVIPQQIITNATPDQFAQIYENLNKGIRLTFGQLLENRKHRPWVSMAEAMIGRNESDQAYADREMLHRVWTGRFLKTKHRSELGFAFQVLAGAERGPEHYHLSFGDHLPLIMSDVAPTTANLRTILQMMDACDPERTVAAKKKKEIFKKFIGAIIHDYHKMETPQWTLKWTTFLQAAYTSLTKSELKQIIDVGTLRGTSSTRIEGISKNVQAWFMEEELDSGTSESDDDGTDEDALTDSD